MGLSHYRRPFLRPERPSPIRSRPLWPAPFLPRRDRPASRPSHHPSYRCESHPHEKIASRSHPPRSQAVPATLRTLLGIPFLLPLTNVFIKVSFCRLSKYKFRLLELPD